MAMDAIFTCHLCLIKSDNVLEIFGKEGTAKSIPDVLRQHFWFDVSNTASFGLHYINIPSQISENSCICHDCWDKVCSFHDFYRLVQQKHQTLLPKCDLDDATDKEDEPKRPEHQTVEHIKLEPEQGDDEDRAGDYDCMDYEETERIMDDKVDTDESSIESEDSSYTADCKTKRGKSRIKPSKPKKLATQRVTKTLQKSLEEGKALTELIAKYITAKCDKCPGAEKAQTFITLEDANDHHLAIHNQPGYLICCEKRLSSKQQLKQHLTWHQDQNKFK